MSAEQFPTEFYLCHIAATFQTVTNQTEYFKVPFTDVLDLVRKRAVFVKKGCAFVSQVTSFKSYARYIVDVRPPCSFASSLGLV